MFDGTAFMYNQAILCIFSPILEVEISIIVKQYKVAWCQFHIYIADSPFYIISISLKWWMSVNYHIFVYHDNHNLWHEGPLLLILTDFNPRMDKELHAL